MLGDVGGERYIITPLYLNQGTYPCPHLIRSLPPFLDLPWLRQYGRAFLTSMTKPSLAFTSIKAHLSSGISNQHQNSTTQQNTSHHDHPTGALHPVSASRQVHFAANRIMGTVSSKLPVLSRYSQARFSSFNIGDPSMRLGLT